LALLAACCGNFFGGWISDYWAKRTGNLRLARTGVAMFGFLLAASAIVPATLTTDGMSCIRFTCLALFGLETTVGVSWAIPLDIGGDYAGSVSAVMNTCGNMGGIVSSVLVAYLASAFGWNIPFFVGASCCLMAAALFVRIDATRRMFAGERAAA
jgi:MFS family permease